MPVSVKLSFRFFLIQIYSISLCDLIARRWADRGKIFLSPAALRLYDLMRIKPLQANERPTPHRQRRQVPSIKWLVGLDLISISASPEFFFQSLLGTAESAFLLIRLLSPFDLDSAIGLERARNLEYDY